LKVDCATLLELTNIVELVLEVEEGVVEEDEADEVSAAISWGVPRTNVFPS